MRLIILFGIFIFLFQNDSSKKIVSEIDKHRDGYETTIDGYKKSELWGDWSMPIGNPESSSCKATIRDITYDVKNICDLNLNTAWVPNGESNGIGEYFEFKIEYPENMAYAGPYQFQGICNVFNGYCKSMQTWKENSRVKELDVYLNDNFIVKVQLLDSWHLQSFDISKFFINKRYRKYLSAKYEIKNGDKLKFKIISVFKGNKYNDVAISEFLCEGAKN